MGHVKPAINAGCQCVRENRISDEEVERNREESASSVHVGTAALGCPFERSSTSPLRYVAGPPRIFLSIGKNYTIRSSPMIPRQIYFR